MDNTLPEAPPIHKLQAHTSDVRVVGRGDDTGAMEMSLQGVEDKLRCEWCGGFHVTNCWAISEATFFPDGRWASVKLIPRPKLEADTIYNLEEAINALAE